MCCVLLQGKGSIVIFSTVTVTGVLVGRYGIWGQKQTSKTSRVIRGHIRWHGTRFTRPFSFTTAYRVTLSVQMRNVATGTQSLSTPSLFDCRGHRR